MKFFLSAAAAAVLVGSAVQIVYAPKPLLVWNVTASAPIGLYGRSGLPIVRGAWVLIRTPGAARELAARRHYLPRNVPMVKRIAGQFGDVVCRFDQVITINAARRAIALRSDSQGRPLPRWSGCVRLRKDQLFLITDPATSFDSRYFGPVSKANLIERIEPLWTF
jgi:conjugative transfer signal peptidase TraF